MSIIIYGPQGCGKTFNSELLRKYFGCDSVVDDGTLPSISQNDDILYLTNGNLSYSMRFNHSVIPYETAMYYANSDSMCDNEGGI